MNKKKIIKIGIPVAAGCIVLALGIGFAVKNSGKAVKVAPVSSLNSGGGTMIVGLQVTEPSQRTRSRTFTWMILCRSHRFT